MGVACRKECRDRRDAVAALFVLNDHWLTPASRQPFCKQPAGNVRAGPRRERDDQLDRALRPALGERMRNGRGKR